MELFDSIAAGYDSWYETDLGRTVDQVERDLAVRLFSPPGPETLEVGCGTGQYTAWLAKKGLKITAVDISPEMLQRAQAKIAALKADVAWIKGDITEILSGLGSYDGIISMTAFEFIPNPEKILAELFKHLKTGGCLVVGLIAGESSWSDFYESKSKNNPESVFSKAAFYTEEKIRSWQVGGRLEIGKCLYFPPHASSRDEALELEQKQAGNPGFIVAKWVKE